MKKTETNDGKKGGLLKGKPHYDKDGNSLGGIKAIVVDSGKPVELEGGEVIINKEASKKYWKELSKINQSAGNGVPILPPNKYDEDPTEYKDGGRVIDFNPNHVPSKRIINYAKTIKQKHPKIWDLGGNIFGNEAFVNLERVSKRGYWLESEEWMYIKWRSYVARHQHDFRIEGVIAMLKWADIVNKGWAYMKDLIEAKIEKTTKMKKGGQIKKYSFVESTTTDGKKVYKLFDFVPTHKQVFEYYQNGTQKNKKQVTIIDSEIKIETFTDFDSDKFLKQANKVAIKEFDSPIDFNKSDLMFKFDKINLEVYPFEAKLKNGLLVEISAVDGVIFIEQVSNKPTRMKQGGEIEQYKEQGILDLNFYPTNSEHAKEYGIKAKNPLFIQNLTVKESDSLKNLDEYAKNNGHDVIFGHIIQKAKSSKEKQKSFLSDVEMIKNWLHNNGYSINQDNNDFHKILTDKQDSVTMDIPLLIRTLELAREDVKSDAELHHVVENLLKLKNKKVLTMDDYEYIAKVKNKHISKMKDGGNVNEAEEKPNFETHLNTYLNNNGIKFEHHNAELEIYNQELELNRLLS